MPRKVSATREGYPEIGDYYAKAAWEELLPVDVIEDGTLDLPFSEKQLLAMQAANDVVLAIFVEAAAE